MKIRLIIIAIAIAALAWAVTNQKPKRKLDVMKPKRKFDIMKPLWPNEENRTTREQADRDYEVYKRNVIDKCENPERRKILEMRARPR